MVKEAVDCTLNKKKIIELIPCSRCRIVKYLLNEQGKQNVCKHNRFPLSIHRAKVKKIIVQVYPCVFQIFVARVCLCDLGQNMINMTKVRLGTFWLTFDQHVSRILDNCQHGQSDLSQVID